MRKLFARLLIFSVLCGVPAWLALKQISPGFNDRFYHKFVSPAPSMITGSSRALYSLNPRVIDSLTGIQGPMLNFAFTQRTSPFGRIYYNAISEKLIEGNKTGTFIVEVSPLSLYTFGDYLSEEELILSKMTFFNLDPNYNYMLKNSQRPLYLFFFPVKMNRAEAPQPSGWNAYTGVIDSSSVLRRGEAQIKQLDSLYRCSRSLDYRLGWMKKTVETLSEHGRVILLRLPVAPEIRKIEDQYYPAFDSLVRSVANQYQLTYLDYSATTGWEYYDMQHMTASSANRFSAALGDTLRRMPRRLARE